MEIAPVVLAGTAHLVTIVTDLVTSCAYFSSDRVASILGDVGWAVHFQRGYGAN